MTEHCEDYELSPNSREVRGSLKMITFVGLLFLAEVAGAVWFGIWLLAG